MSRSLRLLGAYAELQEGVCKGSERAVKHMLTWAEETGCKPVAAVLLSLTPKEHHGPNEKPDQEGLRAHGLGNMTKDIDFLFRNADFQNIAELLVAEHGWVPIMDDPVLFDTGAEREIITLKTPEGLIADFLPAQHAVERRMLTEAMRTPFLHENVMLAPLGGIMLVKAKADRPKDRLALEQAAQYLPKPQLDDAVEWARKRDRATAEDLESMIQEARLRKPNRKSRKART